MKSSKKMFVLTEAVLAVMVAITAIGMLWGQNEEKKGKVSVIVADSDADRWAAFKYGLRMAAQDEEIALFIVNMGERLTAEEEKEAIENEIANGADAVIVQPVPGEDIQEMLRRLKKKVPIILVEDSAGGGARGGDLSPPKIYDQGGGQTLAEEVF